MSDFDSGVIEEFRANAGKVGGEFEGASLILLRHLGSRVGYRARDSGRLLPSTGRPARDRCV